MSTTTPSRESIGKNREFETETHARSYACLRPQTTSEILETVLSYCEEGLGGGRHWKVALDLGCGSGQSAEPLAPFFDKVIGVEVSPSQHAEAQKSVTKPANVTYSLGPGEDLSFQDDESVDLISIGQALHWFQLDTLYKEVRRVLRPGGVFSAYSYGIEQVDKAAGSQLFEKLYYGPLGPYWHEKIKLLDDMYVNVPAPFSDEKRVDHLSIVLHSTLDQAVQYVTSWSAYQSYIREHPDSSLLKDFEEKLLKVYLEPGAEVKNANEIKVTTSFPVIMILSRKPL